MRVWPVAGRVAGRLPEELAPAPGDREGRQGYLPDVDTDQLGRRAAAEADLGQVQDLL